MKHLTNESKITVFAAAGHFFTHFYELLFPSLIIPFTLALKLDIAQVLKLGFLMYLLYGVAALPWGVFADRFGNRLSLVIFFGGTGLGAILTSFADSPLAISLSLATIGFFSSIYHPAGMGLITQGIKKRGHALGVNGVFGNLGLMSAPFAAGLLNWLVGWQITFLIIGMASIAWGVFLAVISIDETPIEAETSPDRNRDATNSNDLTIYFMILCVIMTIAGLTYRTNSIVMPSYLEFRAGFLLDYFRKFQFSNMEGAKTFAATLLASCVYVVSAFGQILGGKLADRHDLRKMYLLFHGMSLPFVLLMAFAVNAPLVVAAALYVFFALGMQPVENSLVAAFTPAKWRSTAYGLKFILVFGVGSLAVYIVSWIKETWSFSAVYLFAGALVALLILFIFLLMWVSRGHACKNN
ncbi:MAG: MFS transporter [Deltaproteobacteria bacterium]|nr:MFS transporter [Deltaproteobacteria bacterium]